MGIGVSIFSRATSEHSGLSDLIDSRCYPNQAPQEVQTPYITYDLVSNPPNNYTDHDGADRWLYRVQINGFADSRDGASELGDQIFDAFHAWSKGTAVGHSMVKNRFNADNFTLDLFQEVVEVVIDHKL